MPDATFCSTIMPERTKPIPAAAKRAMGRGLSQRKAIAMTGNPVSTPVKVG
jgi:hypothetical protein